MDGLALEQKCVPLGFIHQQTQRTGQGAHCTRVHPCSPRVHPDNSPIILETAAPSYACWLWNSPHEY